MGCCTSLKQSDKKRLDELKKHSPEKQEKYLNTDVKDSEKNIQIKLEENLKEKTEFLEGCKAKFNDLDFYEFENSKGIDNERSRPIDWQNFLKKNCFFSQYNIHDAQEKLQENPCIRSKFDSKMLIDIPAKILEFPPMRWFEEQLYLLKKNLQPGNDMGKLSIQRQINQLHEAFKWFVWSVGCYFYINTSVKIKNMKKIFEKLSDRADFGLPTTVKSWESGFVYKNAKFKLAKKNSDEGRALKSEFKAMRIFLLSYTPFAGRLDFHVMSPFIVNMKIGQFFLFAVPVFFQSFLAKGPCLDFEVCQINLKVPESKSFKILLESEDRMNKQKELKPCFLLQGFSDIIQKSEKLGFLCLAKRSEFFLKVVELQNFKTVEKGKILKILNSESGEVNINKSSLFGWNSVVYSTQNNSEKNELASLICSGEVFGDAVVNLALNKKMFRRFPVFYLDEIALSQVFVKNIDDCLFALDTNDSINNSKSFKDLIHRKGLNYSYEWVIYAFCENERGTILIECDILARSLTKILNLEHSSYKSYTARAVSLLSSVINQDQSALLTLSLLLERLKAFKGFCSYIKNKKDLHSKKTVKSYFESQQIIQKIIDIAHRYPGQLFDAFEFHSGLKLTDEFFALVKCDGSLFSRNFTLKPSHFRGFALKISSTTSVKEEAYITLLAFLAKSQSINSIEHLGDSFADWVLNSNKQQKEDPSSAEFIIPCDLYSYSSSNFFKPFYENPGANLIEEWYCCIEPIIKDLISIDSGESILAEILTFLLTLKHFSEHDSSKCLNLLVSLNKIIENSVFIPAEIVISYSLWSGLCHEQINLAISEQHYICSLLLMTKLLGDPRGRKNRGIPWQMLASWKISQIARESNRLPDALAAEEHFDSIYMYSQKSFPKNLDFSLKNPFERWSTQSSKKINSELTEDFCKWMIDNCLVFYQSGKTWGNLYSKLLVKMTKLPQLSTSIFSISGTSTPLSLRFESRRGLQQSSLTQILLPENGALDLNLMVGVGFVWGTDKNGQLGLGLENIDQVTLPYPRMLTSLKDYILKEISTGSEHCIAITAEGLCFGWGKNDNNQLGLGPGHSSKVSYPQQICGVSQVVQVSCGYEHSLLLANDNRIFSMGLGEGGVLGHGNTLTVSTPKQIQGLKSVKVSGISSGAYHSTAIDQSGRVYVWGRGEGGQLGLDPYQLKKTMKEFNIESEEVFIHTPQRLSAELSNKKVTKISCGEAHTIVLTDLKEVLVWGWGSNGQLGQGFKQDDFEEIGNKSCIQYTPIELAFEEGVRIEHISAGGLFSMFITDEKEVLACGMNDFGQLGIENPNRDHKDISVPTRLDCFCGYPISYLVCGENHTLAVSEENGNIMMWAWGLYREGQLGLGDVQVNAAPRPVQNFNNAPIYRIGCGRKHSIAIIGKMG